MDETIKKILDQSFERVHQENILTFTIWKTHILFSWGWWVCAVLTVVPWVLWIWFRKKESTDRLLYAGIFVVAASSWLDFLGVTSGLWSYYVDVDPTIPAFVLLDFSLLPVTVMAFLQIKPHMKPFLKGILYACITSFVGEPFFELLGFYNPQEWNHIYSFPFYFVIFMIAYYLSTKRNFTEIAGSPQ